jgi:undecaprenyl pyrophosphate synthase
MSWKFFRGNRDPAYNEILDRIKAYEKTGDRSLVHVRLDDNTVLLLNQLKLATGVEIQKIIAFSISELIRQHPELRIIVKQFLQKLNE